MQPVIQLGQNEGRWRQFLSEIQELWANRGIDIIGATDARHLRELLQRAGFSERRSDQEVEEMLHSFEEKMRRAA